MTDETLERDHLLSVQAIAAIREVATKAIEAIEAHCQPRTEALTLTTNYPKSDY